MNVLSLFDGISCGRIALERAGINVDNYFASEIDKYAIQIAQKNYPDTIHIGSVTDIEYDDDTGYLYTIKDKWTRKSIQQTNIDVIIGGSPCQDLSIAKKDGKGLQGEKSSLFFEYVRLLKEVKPKYFLLENVASMKKADKEEITRILTEIYPDTQCYLINSSLVSAQNRKRLYWTNIQGVEQPEDKGIFLADILQNGAEVDERMIVNGKSYSLTASYNGAVEWNSVAKKQRTMVRVGSFNTGGQGDRIYSTEGKSVSLSANGGGGGAKTGLYPIYNNAFHEDKAMSLGSNSQCATAKTGQIVIQPPTIRKLTPIECERLQTLPDNYTEGVSNTQRYKSIGNGWTVDVITHIFSYLK